MPLSPAQQEICGSTARFRVVMAGRRFGKTHVAQRELARFARIPHRRVWFIAPTRSQAKGLVWDSLVARLTDLRWIARTNLSELSIDLVNGSTIELRSADAYDRMRGYSVDFAVFDEFADQAEEVWTVVRPTLADRAGHALFIGTPKGNQNWSRGIWDLAADTPGWSRFSYTSLDGGRIPAEEIEAARADMDERLWRQEFMATFEDAGNRVYYNFSRDHSVVPWSGDQPQQILVGQDFNVGAMASVIAVRYDDVLHVIDEIHLPSSNTDEVVSELRSRYPGLRPDRVWMFPDPAARQRKTSAAGRTDLSILQNAGFTVRCGASHNQIRDGVNAVNARLMNAQGQRRLFVEPGCRRLIRSLELLSYKPGTDQVDKVDDLDHPADALRYLVEQLWPIRRDITARQADRRWTHATRG